MAMKIEELQSFCHVIRSGLTSPWSGNGYTYASDDPAVHRFPELYFNRIAALESQIEHKQP
jgi:hypothetical protein